MKTVVDFVLDFVLFNAGVFLGILWFSVIALPVLYGLPRATWWAMRGRVRWRAVARFLAAPIIWSFLFLGAALLLPPSIAQHLQSSWAFAWGQWFGVIVCTVRAIGAPSARQALNLDFLDVVRPHLSPSQMIASAVPEPRAARSAEQGMTPTEVEEIVEGYGAVLAKPSDLGVVRDVGSLPYSKNEIKTTLRIALKLTTDADLIEQLKVGYISLANFQSLSKEEVRALQLWNGALSKNPTGVELNDVLETVSVEGDLAVAVLARMADERHSLARELKAAGFWRELEPSRC
jgi:hypothetical protein